MVSEVGCYGSTKICEHFYSDDQDEHLVTEENMDGLYSKYTVINNQTKAEVHDCFVLKPMSDESARLALLYYADICNNKVLENDIKTWLDKIHEVSV
jgi:hypothetical protein